MRNNKFGFIRYIIFIITGETRDTFKAVLKQQKKREKASIFKNKTSIETCDENSNQTSLATNLQLLLIEEYGKTKIDKVKLKKLLSETRNERQKNLKKIKNASELLEKFLILQDTEFVSV